MRPRWFRGQLATFRLKSSVDDFTADDPGGRERPAAERRHGRARPLAADDRRHGAPRRRRRRACRPSRQRIGHRGTDRARAGVHPGDGIRPEHTILFLSTDGGAFGGLGARHFVEHSPAAKNVLAVVNLDTIGTSGQPGIAISGAGAALAVRDAARIDDRAHRAADRLGSGPPERRSDSSSTSPSRSASTSSGRSSQHRISAITLTTAGDRPRSDPPAARIDAQRLGQVGSAAQALVVLARPGPRADAGNEQLRVRRRPDRSTAGRSRSSSSALVVPFAVAVVDLFARCRRRHVALGTGLPGLPAPARLLALGRTRCSACSRSSAPSRAARRCRSTRRRAAAGNWPRLALTGLRAAGGGELARRARAARRHAGRSPPRRSSRARRRR